MKKILFLLIFLSFAFTQMNKFGKSDNNWRVTLFNVDQENTDDIGGEGDIVTMDVITFNLKSFGFLEDWNKDLKYGEIQMMGSIGMSVVESSLVNSTAISTVFGLEYQYAFMEQLSVAVGPMIGPSFVSTEVFGESDSDTDFGSLIRTTISVDLLKIGVWAIGANMYYDISLEDGGGNQFKIGFFTFVGE